MEVTRHARGATGRAAQLVHDVATPIGPAEVAELDEGLFADAAQLGVERGHFAVPTRQISNDVAGLFACGFHPILVRQRSDVGRERSIPAWRLADDFFIGEILAEGDLRLAGGGVRGVGEDAFHPHVGLHGEEHAALLLEDEVTWDGDGRVAVQIAPAGGLGCRLRVASGGRDDADFAWLEAQDLGLTGGRSGGAGHRAEGEFASVGVGLGEADITDVVTEGAEIICAVTADFELEVVGHRLIIADHGDAFELDRAIVGIVDSDVRVHDDAEHVLIPDRGIDHREANHARRDVHRGRPGTRGGVRGDGRGVGRSGPRGVARGQVVETVGLR